MLISIRLKTNSPVLSIFLSESCLWGLFNKAKLIIGGYCETAVPQANGAMLMLLSLLSVVTKNGILGCNNIMLLCSSSCFIFLKPIYFPFLLYVYFFLHSCPGFSYHTFGIGNNHL